VHSKFRQHDFEKMQKHNSRTEGISQAEAEGMSEGIEELKQLIEDAKWDIKADDLEDARKKLDKAKDIAKKIRNEELLKQVLELTKQTHRGSSFL